MSLVNNCQFCEKTCCPENKTINNCLPLGMILEVKAITQERLAKMTGLTSAAISQIVRGKRDPRFSTVRKIADALRIPMDIIKLGSTK